MYQSNQMDAIRCGPFRFATMQSIWIALISLDAMQCGLYVLNSILFEAVQRHVWDWLYSYSLQYDAMWRDAIWSVSIWCGLLRSDSMWFKTIRCGMFESNRLDAIRCGPFQILTMWSILIALNSLDLITIRTMWYVPIESNGYNTMWSVPFCYDVVHSDCIV